jgi:hypothetical protein
MFAVWRYVNKGKLLSSFFKKQEIDILFVLVSIFGAPRIIYNGESIHRNRQEVRAEIVKQSMGTWNRVGVELLYRPARLDRLAEMVPWNWFLGSLKT